MLISEVISHLEKLAPPALQESYDNSGLLVGDSRESCTGILTCLDVTERVLEEAAGKNCNLVVAHHPLIFRGIKKLDPGDYVARTLISAIQNRIAVYAIHTNLDNVLGGVNSRIAAALGLTDLKILEPREGLLNKLVTFVPVAHVDRVRNALFSAGAGKIGNYSQCSFSAEGSGTFMGSEGTHPFVGQPGVRHSEVETRLEVVLPSYLKNRVIDALLEAHPYEEVAFDLFPLSNGWSGAGSGVLGVLPHPMDEGEFLEFLKAQFSLSLIRHTPMLGTPIHKVALCGGAGSFLIKAAKLSGAQAFITGDIKYHEFFDADRSLLLADIGHYESEQFTIDLLAEILQQKFPNFAVLKTEVNTNPVQYFL